jgi:hypothetical protein
VALVGEAGFGGYGGDALIGVEQLFAGELDAATLEPFSRSLAGKAAEDAG